MKQICNTLTDIYGLHPCTKSNSCSKLKAFKFVTCLYGDKVFRNYRYICYFKMIAITRFTRVVIFTHLRKSSIITDSVKQTK